MSSASCTESPVKCFIEGQINIIANIANSMQPVEKLITGTAYIMGIMFAVKAIYTLKVYGESRTMMSSNSSIKEPIIYFIVAAIFIYLPTSFQYILNTVYGPNSSILAYAPLNTSNSTLDLLFGQNSAIGPSLAMIIQVIGLIAFIRGWVLIARAASHGQPPGGTGKGLMHVFGGIMAMNIVQTLEIINNTLYGT